MLLATNPRGQMFFTGLVLLTLIITVNQALSSQ